MWYKNVDFRFVTMHAFDRRTDGQTDRNPSQYRALHCMQLHGKNPRQRPITYLQFPGLDWDFTVRAKNLCLSDVKAN